MAEPRCRVLWDDFCQAQAVLERSADLFATSNGVVDTLVKGQEPRLILRRSLAMETLLTNQIRIVLQDFASQANRYDGVIYMMFWPEDGRVVPLYIGKAGKFGKAGTNLSANLAGALTDRSKFCRWGDNYAYHIGDLSAAVCPGHQAGRSLANYRRWAETLFEDAPTERPRLRRPVRLWVKAWPRGEIGIWQEFGPTPLDFLEYLMIGVASNLFPEVLLNHEGARQYRSRGDESTP